MAQSGRSFLFSRLRRPEDVEFFFEVGEVFVAGGERGFAMDSEGFMAAATR
jgi:hypothetical protein